MSDTIEDLYPLTPLQKGLLFHALGEPAGGLYVNQLVGELRGRLDVEAFAGAWREALRLNPVLRTAFEWEGVDEPLQVVLREVDLPLAVEDWRDVPAAELDARLERLLADERRRGFALDQAPLLRLWLLRTGEDAHHFVFSHHHLLLDGWSLPNLLRQIFASYDGLRRGSPLLLEPPRLFRDYVAWLGARGLAEAEAHFRRALAGAELPTPLGILSPRTVAGDVGHGEAQTALTVEATRALGEAAKRHRVTPNTLVQAAWALALGAWAGRRDVTYGTTLAGRPPELAGAERMVGLFINTLPVRARWAPAERLADWLAGLQAQLAELGQHEHAPLYEVGRWAGAPSGAPLFDSLLVFENYPVDEALQASLPGLEITATRSVEADHYPLSLAAVPGPPMRFVLSHDRARVDGGTAEWLLAQFMRLLDRMVERPEALVGDLWALEGDERQRIIVDWNATRAEFPRGACLHDLVAARTREAPDAVAVARGGERWSYARLEARSNALARALGARGVGPGAVVGVCLGRSGELVAAQLALLKAGGAYLPLDPTHPSERLAYLLEDSGARLVITDAQAGAALPSPRAGLDRLRVDEAPGDADAPSELPAPDGGARPDDLAYVIYTSGSTGRPKGVAVTHRNLVNFVSWYARACSLGPSDRVPLLSGLTFDASALELWPALAAGASVHVPDEEARSRPGRLLAWLAEQKASVAFAPTPLAEALLQEPWLEGLALRVLLAGGDALRQRPEAGWRARVVNVYGPTETTIVATTAEVDARAGEAPPPPIGRPIANARAYVLDEALGPVPAGLPGELYVGGEGVARGYSGRPGLTAERFLPDPFAPEPGARMYRTGDRARFLDDGQLEFLGRIDRQVKLRGFRIEPGEIEAALHELEGVAAAAVVLREGRLVGYVVPRPGRALDPGALREALARRLPASMVPSAFVLLDALPLTPHGKIDWRALPPPDAAEARGPEGGEPRGVAEAMLASIWGELLGRERVGRGANFFELGGHSLAAMQLASRVRDAFGVELSVRAAFEAPTLQEMAALVERARRGERVLPPVTASPDRGPAPLSFAQERLWFLDRLSPGNPAYNVPLTLRLRGPLDAGALEAALGALVERHDVLRTVFADEGGRPSQRVVSECALALPLERLEGASDEAIRQAAEAEATRPFDLGRGPLVRAKLLRLADADHVLVLTAHHIVCDAWSLGIVAGELSSTYVALTRGEAPGLPELPVRYADYAAWQRERLGPEALAGEIEWWRARLEGAPSALELPTDRPRPPARALQGGHLRAHLPAEVAGPLRELCRREGVTPFMALLAAFYALLCRQSGQRDLVVGTPVAGRPRPELEPLVGFFLNTLALRVRVGEAASFRELVGRVREATLDALAHQDLPFERLVEALKPPRDPSRSPIFQAMFVYEGPAPALALPGVEATPLDVEPGWAKFDLTLSARDDAGGGLDCSWEYDRALFDAETVERLAAHYGRLLAGALADPDRALGDLPLVTDEERRLLLEAGAGGPRAAWGPLAEALTEQAGRTPDAVALAFGGREISFAELDARSNQIARALRRRGVGPGGLVGVCLPRSLELPLAVWGALKAGGAYVPLDPDYPPARLEQIARDAGLGLVLCAAETAALVAGAEALPLGEGSAAWAEPADPLAPGASAESLAYVLYTSGSTGRPKGVAVRQGAVRNLVAALRSALALPARPLRFSLNGPLAFDTSVKQLFQLLDGHALDVTPDEVRYDADALIGYLERQQVDVFDCTPTHLRALLAAGLGGRARPGLKVLVGGEPVDPALWAALGAAERLEAYNLYGPTECTVDATAARVRAGTRPSLGRALGGVRLYALDARGEPAPPGAPAELHIGGVGVALGYVGRAGLTAERFVPDPFAGEPGARLYRTGDRVRLRPDGELEFLGRLDRQIKLRGVRIELGEVEAALGEIDGVAAAAAALREGAGGEARLVAYVVARDGRALDPGALREALVRRLPASMVPSVFVPLDALPRTPQGKLDRDALPPPEPPAADAGREGGEPRGATEAALASIWGELLGREGLGREANFFELGGHSLLATRVLARVRSSLGAELPLRAIFEAPTLAALAARIDAAAPSAPPEPAPRRRAPEEEPALSFAQRRLWFLDQLTPGDPAYNLPMALRLTGELDAGALADALAALARRHEALRTTFDERDGLPVARVHGEDFVPPLRAIDLRAHDETGRERALAELAADEAARPFDLREGPLVRAALARLGGREHALFLTAHHAVTDGWSGGILAREFALLYEAIARGEAPRLPELPLQYADYAAWQRERLEGPWLRGELDHWRRALEGAPRLELPADRRPPPGAASRRAGTVALTLAPPLAGRLRALAAEEGCTPFMALLAGFQALLARYTGQGDLSVGTPVAGRTRLELEGLVGLFVNTLVLRTRVEAARSFRALLGRARETCLEAFAHQELPFERLVEELRPERDLSGTPLFRVFFALQNVPRAEVTLGGLTFAPLGLPTAAAKFDLSLRLEERGDAIEGELEYRADLFDRATAERLARHLVALLSAALDRPDAPLDRLPLLDDGERRLLLEAGAGGPRAAWGTLAEAFTAQVARAPAALALAFVGRELSFAELDARSNQIARALRRRGVGPDTPVGLCLPRSLELVVAVWGVLKAGGAYVPLDPEYPAKRLAFIARDARLGLVLCARTTAALVAGADAFALDPGEPVWAEPTDPLPASGASADSLAYILYTSGSTGSPKGVAVRQGAVRNLVAALRGPLGLGARPLRFSLNGPLAFDTSVKQLFQLLDGHALDVTPDEVRYDADALIDYLERQQVDVFDCTPTHLRALLAAGLGGRARPGLKVLVGGEPVDPALWAALGAAERLEAYNLYGPTECTVDATAARVRDWPGPTLGRPLAGVGLYVLEAGGELAPPGVPGELCVGGVGVARGYLGRPALTAERFVPDPFSPEPGARLYRTGDLVRRLPDGRLEFLGRADHQVKVRGHRVELGEVEAALSALPGVRRAAAALRGGRLVAYVSVEGGDVAALERQLRASLPPAFVPSAIVELDDWPLLPSGKLDRARLPDPASSRPARVEPRTPAERELAALWRELLGVEQVGSNDHFFELGGHSLLATRLVARVRSAFGVELPLRALFEAPTLAALAARIDAAPPGASEPPLRRREGPAGPAPLSSAQERLWLLQRLSPESPAYNVPLALWLEGVLDRDALGRALDALAGRHEVLRSIISLGAGGPVQEVDPSFSLRPRFVDLRELAPAARAEAARALAEAEVRRPFSFDEGPPARALLVATGEREHLLVINLHHAVTDGWSGGILARELLVLYEGFAHGGPAELPPLPLQYADYAAWQRERLAGPAARAELDYWRRTLAGVPPLELPLDRARGASASRQAGHEAIALDHALSARLRAFAREAGATPFMVLATALKALLHRYSGQTDLALGTPVAGRSRPELEPLVGCFINSLVVRTDLSGDPSFADALGRVRDVTLAALTHQEAPFEQVVDALSAPRDLGLTPLFQAMLVVHAAPAPVVALPELTMRPAGAEAGAAKLDLMLELHETPAGLEGTWEYDAGLFEAATIRRLSRHFVRLLERALDAPEKPIGELELLDGAERHRTLVAWNASRADFPRDACLHHLFEAQARRAPDATAIVEGDRSLTYAGLEERAERLAAALRARGVGPERRVGVCLERSIDLVVALLGVLKAGGAYVPLDPEHPRDRLAFLVHDADPALLLTQGSLAGGLPAEGRPVLCVDREPGGDDAGPDVVDFFAGESSLPRAEHAAYVLYTSGSTGRPKGAINTHRAVVNRVWWMQSAYPLREGERVLQKTPSGFDVSVWEFFWPLAVGATLALARPGGHRDPAYLERAIGDHDVRVVHFVPSMLRAFLGALGGRPLPASLRHVVCSGEALTADLVARFFEAAAPGQQLHNLYGPTEAAIDVSAWACRPDDGRDGGPVPIGRPIANVRLYVLDRQGRPAPPGAAGELCIGGVAVGRGYLGRPALTAERFVPDPFAGEPGARLYRTGDRARWRHDGQIEFLGRLDRQVKVRGHRVEPAEIEATLAAHGALRACAVAARPAPGGDVDLVAYLVPAGGAGAAEEVAASVEAFARQRLPGALVPAHFVCLDELPTTASGKLDHRALPAPAPRRLAPRAEPRDERERELVAIWQEALGVAPLGVDDDFFEQGGNSLKALRAVARIEAALGRPLPLARLFERPTVASLLAALDAPEAAGAPYLHTFRASGRRAPLVLVHAVEGHALAYRELARALGPERPIYALRARGLEAGEAPLDDLEAMASLYLDEVRRVRPRGPYVLGGWSMGGAVAFEMARKLAQAGEGLAPVVLIDAFAPGGEVLGPEGELERLAGLGNELARRAGHAIEPVTPLELRQVPEGDRVAYLCGRAFGARGASAELAALRPEALVRVALANARALASYRSAPYAGPALLLRARAGRDEGRPRPDHGWGPLAPGLAIEDVAGDHRSVVQAPHVEGLAAAIDRWLERHEPAPG